MSGRIKTLPSANRYVLDSFAIIGFLENELFSDQIEALLRQAQKGRAVLFLHCIHLGEVYYITLREKGQQLADLAYDRIKALPVTIIEHIEERLLKKACSFKASFPISYADSFAAALAEINHCQLLTGDPEFEPLEKRGHIRIAWLASKQAE
jgi:predicted nucleic acid-binding protein